MAERGTSTGRHVLAVLPRLWPTWGAGTQRSTALLDGVVASGVRVTALVATAGPVPDDGGPVPDDRVRRIYAADPSGRIPWPIVHVAKALGLPDDRALAHRHLRRSIPDERIDAVFTSGPPWSAVTLAARMARQRDVPLIVDMRDEWAGNPFQVHLGPLFHRLERHRERAALGTATAITAPFVGVFDALVDRAAAPTHVVAHGCHVAEIRSRPVAPTPPVPIVLFAGARYGKINEEPLLRLLAQRPPPEPIVLHLVGSDRPTTIEAPPGVTVRITPAVPHDELLDLYAQASVLLTIAPDDRGPSWLPSKLPEYEATGRPILAVGPPHTALLDRVGSLSGGWPASITDADQLHDALAGALADARTRTDHAPSRAIRDWTVTGAEFAAIVTEAIDRADRSRGRSSA